ncbi:Anaphase spindle elongation protein [Spathaspora sp. JA1]|nr:Anaphase spindle elongation protein [Spathaspora sp. JA1]
MSFIKSPSVPTSENTSLFPGLTSNHNSGHEPISATSTPSQAVTLQSNENTNTDIGSTSAQCPSDCTGNESRRSFQEISAKQLDEIGSVVNQTISELTAVYNDIGFTDSEISNKQQEIFTVIQDTITNFSAKVYQERANIVDECEWLRQQVQIILAMINDNKGEKSLSLIERGLEFKNKDQYEDGYKEEVLTKFSNSQFACSSPFNDSGLDSSAISIEQQYDNMLNNIPTLSLSQMRSQLNNIFLKVLKLFMISFRKFNNLNLEYNELVDFVGPYNVSSANASILQTLPSNTDAEYHKRILDDFEFRIQQLNLDDENNNIVTGENHNYFIISSPRKNSIQGCSNQNEHTDVDSLESPLEHLQNLNYQIIRIIRGLRFTKITSEFLSTVQSEIDKCKIELTQRKENVCAILNQIFECLDLLQMTDETFKEMQKRKESPEDDVLLDIETLKTIQKEPLEFGVHNSHIEFLSEIQTLLKSTVDARQTQYQQYSKTCIQLWEKLGESEEYVASFMQKNSSLTERSLVGFKMELSKLYIRRSKCIDKFITDARNDIEMLWDKMYYSRSMRSEFEFFNYDQDNSDVDKEFVLSKHEEEIVRLNEEYAVKEPIFQMYEELQDLVKDQEFLKEASKDSSRLVSKNSCKILLNEEKLRKKINKNMPRLIESLIAQVYKYNSIPENNNPLSVNGQDLYDKLLSIQREQQSSAPRRSKSSSIGSRVSPHKKSIQKLSPQKKPQSISRSASTLRSFTDSPTKTPVNRISKVSLNSHTTRTYNNPTTIQISNAITSSFSSTSTSPTRILGNIPSLNSQSELPPLNHPLRPLSILSQQNSPLRLNTCQTQKLGSPAFQQVPEDKENNSSPFHLSPIRVKSKFFETPNQLYRRPSSNTSDNTTIIGDEYKTWREEKIRQNHAN